MCSVCVKICSTLSYTGFWFRKNLLVVQPEIDENWSSLCTLFPSIQCKTYEYTNITHSLILLDFRSDWHFFSDLQILFPPYFSTSRSYWLPFCFKGIKFRSFFYCICPSVKASSKSIDKFSLKSANHWVQNVSMGHNGPQRWITMFTRCLSKQCTYSCPSAPSVPQTTLVRHWTGIDHSLGSAAA